MGSINEKNRGQKSRDTAPLSNIRGHCFARKSAKKWSVKGWKAQCTRIVGQEHSALSAAAEHPRISALEKIVH